MNDQAGFAVSMDEGRSMATRINEYDWKSHPLGEIQTWPQALRNFVSTMLASRFPMYLAWGDQGYSFYNDGYIPILTDKHPNALGGPFQTVWSELPPDFMDMIERTKLDQTSYYEDMPLALLKNGKLEQCYFTFSYSGVRGDSGDVEGFYAVCLETTDAFHSKQKHVNENERLRTLFQQAPGYIAVVSGPNHIFEIANDAYHRLIGSRELIGKPVGEAVPELVAQGYIRVLDEILQTGKAYFGQAERVLLQRGPGGELEERFLNFILQPIVDASEKASGVFIEGSDVTAAVNAAAVLRDSEARLRQLANNLPHLAWMANPDGHIHWYNDRWYAYTGTTIETMAGWGWKSVHDPKYLPEVIRVWTEALENGHQWEATFPLRSASGEFRMFASRAVPLRDEHGKIVQWFGTNTDVTDELAAQDEIRKASQRKDEFLAMLAHELRNPLAPINSAADLLSAVQLNPDRVRETAKVISRQVSHITKLVDDLLDVSRVTRGLVTLRVEILDINRVVAEAIEQVQALAEAKHHQLDYRQQDLPIYVRGDRTRLVQVFANVLNNAIRYTPPNGKISAQVTEEGGKAIISVADNGIGVLPTLAPHIFDLFTQGERSSDRSQGGLGLGLALVKSLVELHDGRVSVHSDGAGKGSKFIVELPQIFTAAGARSESDRHGPALVSTKTRHLMVVDDNQDAAQMLSMLLETAGHTVLVAHDGHAALRVAQETMPAMCFLDIGLPDMDGYELAKRLRQIRENASTVLVAVTGYGQPEDRDRALKAGFDHHLVKPVKLTAVLDLVEKLG
jgi:PAS domain S-box-containing protein